MSIFDLFSKLNSKDKKDDKELVSYVNTLFETSETEYTRKMRERIWFRNLLYYLGEQYLEYVKSSNSFRRRTLPDFIPTPVSNEIREYVRTVKAMILQQKFSISVAPNTAEREDIKAAELGVQLLTWLDNVNEGEFLDEKEKVAVGVPLFGTTFMRVFPKMYDDRWVFDKDGNSITLGDVCAENIIPFQVFCDALGDRLVKKRWVGIQSLKPQEWVEDTFKVKLGAGTDKMATDYIRQLMKMVGNVSKWKGGGIDNSMYSPEDDGLVLFREIEMKPTINHPNGRYVLTCGDKLLKSYERMPIKCGEDKQWQYTLTDFHHDYLPGSFWSEAGVNNLISPQDIINEVDQALAINRKGVARPVLFLPGDVGLKKLDDAGSLGVGMIALQYDPLLSGNQAPSISQGTPLPQQILMERDVQRRTIQDVSGDPKNILRGESPGSKASGIMVDILRETAERGHYPDMDRFTRSMTRVNKKRLLVAQEVMTEERILKIAGRGNRWKAVRFKAADLRSNTDVRMELDSGLATTNAGQIAILSDFAQKGLFGDITQNPKLKEELLRRAGMSGLTKQESVDYKRAETENAKIAVGDFQGIFLVEPDKETGEMTPESEVVNDDPYFKYDNHEIHYETHREFMLSDEFAELPQQAQTILIHHADIHHMQIMEAMKNQPPEPKDPREFVQMDKLYPFLDRKEQEQILITLGVVPTQNVNTVGVLTAQDRLEAELARENATKPSNSELGRQDKVN
jgi:hypothetical protein